MADKPFRDTLALIKGAGELASGVAYRLHQAGFQVVMTELAEPTCVCHAASFAEAIPHGRKTIDGASASHATSAAEALDLVRADSLAVLADPGASVATELQPTVLVDAIMAKRNTGTRLADAPIVVGLGPGFLAGDDVHAVIETKRGHRLGWVIVHGAAEPNTGVPEAIAGETASRLLLSPARGSVRVIREIGQRVRAGEVVAEVGGEPVTAPLAGVLRGLLPAGYSVDAGTKIGDVDPLAEPEYCFSLSDRALAVGSGVLAAVLELWPTIPAPVAAEAGLPPKRRGRKRATPGEELLGPEEFALLGLLIEQPAHGYDLARAFEPGADLGAIFRLRLSQLYAVLAKLESLGLVTSAPVPAGGHGRGRKVFSIAPAGQRQFQLWLGRPVRKVRYLRVDFMAKLYFARRAGGQTAGMLIEDQAAVIAHEIEGLAEWAAVDGFQAEVAAARRAFAQASLRWLSHIPA
ncbi:MAG: selenium-dependent molybdenum cofactor biosynthesis protein YqeB [Chloroflexota bacterium]